MFKIGRTLISGDIVYENKRFETRIDAEKYFKENNYSIWFMIFEFK